jgi:hypothetical protein
LFNIKDLPPIVKTAFLQETVNLTIKGDVTIPAKVFGLFTYTQVTVSYSVTDEVSGEESGTWNEPEPVILSDPVRILPEGLRLDWTVSTASDFEVYEVHMSTTSAFEPDNDTLVEQIFNVQTNTAEIHDLQSLTTYYFKIVVVTTHDLSSVSNEVYFTYI